MHSSSEISFNLPRTLSVNQVSWWAYQAWESFLVLLAMTEREASTTTVLFTSSYIDAALYSTAELLLPQMPGIHRHTGFVY